MLTFLSMLHKKRWKEICEDKSYASYVLGFFVDSALESIDDQNFKDSGSEIDRHIILGSENCGLNNGTKTKTAMGKKIDTGRKIDTNMGKKIDTNRITKNNIIRIHRGSINKTTKGNIVKIHRSDINKTTKGNIVLNNKDVMLNNRDVVLNNRDVVLNNGMLNGRYDGILNDKNDIVLNDKDKRDDKINRYI